MKDKTENPRVIARTWRIVGQTTTSVLQWVEARRLRRVQVHKDNQAYLKKKGKRFHN